MKDLFWNTIKSAHSYYFIFNAILFYSKRIRVFIALIVCYSDLDNEIFLRPG